MFQSHTTCSANSFRVAGNTALLGADPGVIGRRVLAAAAAVAFVASVAALPGFTAAPPAITSPHTVIVHAPSTLALRDRTEALRAQMLAHPGVAAVRVEGLQQQALSVQYDAARLGAFGLSVKDLRSALQVDDARSRPGSLALRTDEMQVAADTQFRAGGRQFRLGDVAHVLREKLETPLATLTADGEPAARLVPINAQ